MNANCEEILKPIFENNPIALIVADRHKKITAFNKKASEWSGRHFTEPITLGSDIRKIISREDLHDFENAFDNLSELQNHIMVSILQSIDGQEFWYETNISPLNENDKNSPVLIAITDNTNNRKTIDYLAESEKKHKSLLQNSAGIVLVVDEKSIIQYVTDNCQNFLGFHPSEMRGSDLISILIDSDIPRFRYLLENTLKDNDVIHTVELQFIKKDSTSAFFDLSISNQLSNPVIKGIVVNMHDITEKRLLDELMVRISRQNELILDTAREGIFGTNKKGYITFINPYGSSILGYSVEDLTGIDYTFLVSKSGVYEKNHPLIGALSGNIYRNNIDTYFYSKTGEQILVEFSFSPIITSGLKSGFVVTFEDISERKRFEEQLRYAKEDAEKATNAKSEFLAAMSHEIRTPMNGILGFLEILSMSDLSDDQKSYVKIAHDNAQHLLGIINDILDFSRIEKGMLELESIPFMPQREFQSLISLLSVRAASKNIRFTTDIDDIPAIEGDPLKIIQVMTNLIGNAVKFTPDNGSISTAIKIIDLNDRFAKISFSVSDSGIGIPPERHQAIFESFTQSDSSMSRRFGGSGLGLSISAALVSLMGGSIHLKSEVGKGSTFSFALKFPRAAENIDEFTEQLTPNISFMDLGFRVLVADDTLHVRQLMALMLEKIGLTAEFAFNGQEALDKYPNGDYDLILMDGNMPVMSGTEAAIKIREYEQHRGLGRTPIIALSARAVKGDRERFLESGMDDYLVKPVTLHSLSTVISKYLAVTFEKQTVKKGDIELSELEQTLGLDRHTIIMLIREFVHSLDGYAADMEKGMRDKDLSLIENTAHKLKGMALTYKFIILGECAAQAENYAGQHDLYPIEILLKTMKTEIEKIKREYR